MNTTMWENPATRRNIETLKNDGVYFVEPVSGELACKTVGTGKLEDVENIVSQALKMLDAETQRRGDAEISEEEKNLSTLDSRLSTDQDQRPKTKDLKTENILITVGSTREAIDPVRFISNHSSGKMGFALAEMARRRGAKVTVVCGVTSVEAPKDVQVVRAISAEEMFQAVRQELPNATVFIGAAAVSDYRPAKKAATKIKKTEDILTLELEKTTDILSSVSQNRHNGLLVVGFAAETNDVAGYAKSKLEKKNLDLVVANDITKTGAGFNSDTNIATILKRGSDQKIELPLMSKHEMADKILDQVVKLRKAISES